MYHIYTRMIQYMSIYTPIVQYFPDLYTMKYMIIYTLTFLAISRRLPIVCNYLYASTFRCTDASFILYTNISMYASLYT